MRISDWSSDVCSSDLLPEGFSLVTPPGRNVPTASGAMQGDRDYDGASSRTVAANGPARRLLKVPLPNCIADNLRGDRECGVQGQNVEVRVTLGGRRLMKKTYILQINQKRHNTN